MLGLVVCRRVVYMRSEYLVLMQESFCVIKFMFTNAHI